MALEAEAGNPTSEQRVRGGRLPFTGAEKADLSRPGLEGVE